MFGASTKNLQSRPHSGRPRRRLPLPRSQRTRERVQRSGLLQNSRMSQKVSKRTTWGGVGGTALEIGVTGTLCQSSKASGRIDNMKRRGTAGDGARALRPWTAGPCAFPPCVSMASNKKRAARSVTSRLSRLRIVCRWKSLRIRCPPLCSLHPHHGCLSQRERAPGRRYLGGSECCHRNRKNQHSRRRKNLARRCASLEVEWRECE